MNTEGLRTLQEQLQSHLLHRDERVLTHIAGSRRVSGPARLQIYFDAYRLRLLEALRVDFPALHTLAGDTDFEGIGRAYIDALPSEHFSIRYFGRRMSEFLAGNEPFCTTPVFAEMAAFEWALGLSFDAADSVTVTFEEVAAIPESAWAEMRIRLHPSVRLLDLRWNVPALWNAIKREQPPQEPVAAEHPQAWIIWRRGLQTYFRSASVDEAWAINALRADQSFADLCTGLCEWIDEQHVATHAATSLRRWVNDGLIAHVDLP